jgi:uncharacterized membrane protein
MSETVAARPAPALSIRRARWQERVLRTLWFIPMCASVAAALISRATVEIDRRRDLQDAVDLLLPGDPTALATAASTVATAMLTFLGVVFATTLVAIQLAASQYSPRIVRVFVRSRVTQWTLGIFLATFVFSLNALIATRESADPFVPAVTATVMYLLVFATIGTFIAFMHHMVQLLRVQYLLRMTARASHDAIDQAFPPADAYAEVVAPAPGPASRIVRPSAHPVGHRGTPRVLQAIDVAGLAEAAARSGCWVDVAVAVGEHAGPLATIATVHGPDPSALSDDAVHAHLLFGSERTLLGDPGFGLRQLVDTASRALSPAINDPTTGVQALLRVEDLLARIADRPDPTGWYLDASGAPRVHLNEPSFLRLAALGLTEILHYGATAPQVTRALLATATDLAAATDGERRAWFESYLQLVHDTVREQMPPALVDVASEVDRMGLG